MFPKVAHFFADLCHRIAGTKVAFSAPDKIGDSLPSAGIASSTYAPSLANILPPDTLPSAAKLFSEKPILPAQQDILLPVKHVYQYTPEGRGICRLAALSMVKEYARSQGKHLTLPRDIYNNRLVTRRAAGVVEVAKVIDENLQRGLPAIVYVNHDYEYPDGRVGGRHVIVVIGRKDGRYIFLDPGASSSEPRELVLEDGNFIKPREPGRENVPGSYYSLHGVFPYQDDGKILVSTSN